MRVGQFGVEVVEFLASLSYLSGILQIVHPTRYNRHLSITISVSLRYPSLGQSTDLHLAVIPTLLSSQLFAKHFKLAEQIDHLQKTKIGIAVGTPGRIAKILKESGESPGLNSIEAQDWKKASILGRRGSITDLI